MAIPGLHHRLAKTFIEQNSSTLSKHGKTMLDNPTVARPAAEGKPKRPAKQRGQALTLGALVLLVFPTVLGAASLETFDDQTPPAIPQDDDYTFTSNPTCVNALVSNLQAHSSPNSVRMVTGPSTCITTPNHAYMNFEYTNGFDLCADDGSFTFWTYMSALPSSGTNVKYIVNGAIGDVGAGGSDSVYIQVNNIGEVTVQASSSISKTLLGVTFPVNTWVDFTMAAADCDVGETDGATFSSNALVFVHRLQHATMQNIQPPLNNFQVFDSVLNHVVFVDDLLVPSDLQSEQYPVNNLVGYSMDATGRNIITREEGGIVVKTYSATDITAGPTNSFATPNCNRSDGVVTVTLRNVIYTSFVDCDSVNQRVDTIRIRGSALQDAPFDSSCTETEQNIDNSDIDSIDFEIPESMKEIGTLSDFAFDFRKCTSAGTNNAAATWTFSTDNSPAGEGGYVGIFGIVFNSFDNARTDVEKIQLDTSPLPELTQLCSWRDEGDGLDYLGGVTQNGPTGFYRGTAQRVDLLGGTEDIEVEMEQVFLNSGTYANALGASCSSGTAFLVFEDKVVTYQGITETPALGIKTTPITSGPLRGGAISGDGNFVAWVDESLIMIAHAGNHTITGTFEVPSGQWRGMEFDDVGEKLAVFTSDFITIIETSPITCELTTCEGTSNDDGTGPPITPSPTETPSGDPEDSPYFIVFLLILVLCFLLVFVGLVTGSFPPLSAYGVVSLVAYIGCVLLVDGVSPWPIIALAACSIGFFFLQFKSGG